MNRSFNTDSHVFDPVENDYVNAWVIISSYYKGRSATRFDPEEYPEVEWYLSEHEDGEYSEKLHAMKFSETAIENFLWESLNYES